MEEVLAARTEQRTPSENLEQSSAEPTRCQLSNKKQSKLLPSSSKFLKGVTVAACILQPAAAVGKFLRSSRTSFVDLLNDAGQFTSATALEKWTPVLIDNYAVT